MQITAQMVKALRDKTGAGPLDCKKALTEFDGDMEKAAAYLQEKGLVKAASKAGRATNEGIIEIYQHHNRRVGVMLESVNGWRRAALSGPRLRRGMTSLNACSGYRPARRSFTHPTCHAFCVQAAECCSITASNCRGEFAW